MHARRIAPIGALLLWNSIRSHRRGSAATPKSVPSSRCAGRTILPASLAGSGLPINLPSLENI